MTQAFAENVAEPEIMPSALRALDASVAVLTRSSGLSEILASTRMVEALGAAGATPAPPREAALAEMRARIVAASISIEGVSACAPKDMRDAPWLLWHQKEPLALVSGVLDAVLEQASREPRTLRMLIFAWLQSFDRAGYRMRETGAAIAGLIAANNDLRFNSWRSAHQKAVLFDAERGPEVFARWLVAGPEPVGAILAASGFDDPVRAVSGYMRAVQFELLTLAPALIGGSSGFLMLERVKGFLIREAKLRFDDAETWGAMARGLLGAWMEEGKRAEDVARREVQILLLRHLGDPRIRKDRWQPAGTKATGLMKRWLARASLKAFFDLISEHAPDRQWVFRSAFWSACLDKGAIDDAWLALGKQVHSSARSITELGRAFARLEAAGASADHAVLLLRLGDTVFCEWSHVGKLRAWPVEWPNAPRLGEMTYNRDELTNKSLPFPPNPTYGSRGSTSGSEGLRHFNGESNYWQGSAAALLRQRIGLQLTHHDWKPRP